MAIHSSTLAWIIPWTEERCRLQSMGSQRVGHDWATSLSLSNYGGGNEDKGDLLQDPKHALLHSVPPTLQQATSNPHPYWRLLDTRRQVWVSFCGVSVPSPGPWCTGFCLCPLRVYFPVLCNFWQLYGGVNGALLQEGLCHTQVCCTQSPCPCCSSLLTHTSTGNAQTQFCLNLCGVPG